MVPDWGAKHRWIGTGRCSWRGYPGQPGGRTLQSLLLLPEHCGFEPRAAPLVGAELAEDLLDPATGEVLFSAGLVVDEEAARKIEECGISRARVIHRNGSCLILSNGGVDLEIKHLVPADIVAAVSYILNLMDGIGEVDDIDHLGNRRLRSVGELLQNQFRIGLSRMERVVRERMTIQDVDAITPQALINIRPVIARSRSFLAAVSFLNLWIKLTPWRS